MPLNSDEFSNIIDDLGDEDEFNTPEEWDFATIYDMNGRTLMDVTEDDKILVAKHWDEIVENMFGNIPSWIYGIWDSKLISNNHPISDLNEDEVNRIMNGELEVTGRINIEFIDMELGELGELVKVEPKNIGNGISYVGYKIGI